ncbi:MAG: SurA N-terminal domain-containing protein [Endomicrobiales bacterium]|nr:SurA N-terminal domain-containing protein [Endomicrobiales bacterium]
MMEFLRKHRQTIFIITISGFFAGVFVGFGGYFLGRKSINDAVAEVNNIKIPYKQYVQIFNRSLNDMRKEEDEITEDLLNKKKQEVLQDLIQEEVFWQEAKKYGITISDGELAADIHHYPAFQQDGRFDQRAYYHILRNILHTTPKQFEESRRRQIAIFKLRHLIASSVGISEAELRFEYARANKGDMSKFNEERASFMENLKQQKVSMVFAEWFKKLNQTVKIKVHLQEIEGGA